jgi:hypothetical protein
MVINIQQTQIKKQYLNMKHLNAIGWENVYLSVSVMNREYPCDNKDQLHAHVSGTGLTCFNQFIKLFLGRHQEYWNIQKETRYVLKDIEKQMEQSENKEKN